MIKSIGGKVWHSVFSIKTDKFCSDFAYLFYTNDNLIIAASSHSKNLGIWWG